MKTLLDTIKALKTTISNVLRPPVTYEFPDVIRPRAVRYRASFALPDDEHGEVGCIACMACEKICPSQIIKIKSTGKRESPVTGKKRQYSDEFTLDLAACIQCELCVQVCNSDAIIMVREPEQPAYAREDLVLDLEKLRANFRNRTAAWGKGTLLQEMQESKPKAEPKPKAEAKPAEAKPAEAKPAEAKPAEAKPAEAKPVDPSTAEAKATEAKPADGKPAETKPADAKPAETKPADVKPAAAAPVAAGEGGA
ncbi:MAG: 4Fe-4S dicluster domain-containing protein [Polyangiales bacterium]